MENLYACDLKYLLNINLSDASPALEDGFAALKAIVPEIEKNIHRLAGKSKPAVHVNRRLLAAKGGRGRQPM